MLEEDEQLEAGEINDNDNKKRKKRWKRKKKKHDYRNKLENWEQCTVSIKLVQQKYRGTAL